MNFGTVITIGFQLFLLHQSDGNSVRGQQFFIAYPELLLQSGTASIINLTVIISNPTKVNVTATIQFPKLTSLPQKTLFIWAGESVTLGLDESLQLVGSLLQKKSIHLQATDDVEVQVVSSFTTSGIFSTGSYRALPLETLSNDYVIATHCSTFSCFSVVVITADNTTVRVALRVPTNKTVTYEGKVYANNDVIEVTANLGDVVQVLCRACDLSGTRIKTSLPVSVIAGGQFTHIDTTDTGKDMVVEQFFPWVIYGKRYVLSRDLIYPISNTEIIKVITGDVNTTFTLDDVTYTSTTDRQVFQFERLPKNVSEIAANGRILVAQFCNPKSNNDAVMVVHLSQTNWGVSYDVFLYCPTDNGCHLTVYGQMSESPKIESTLTVVKCESYYGNYGVVTASFQAGAGRVYVYCHTSSSQCGPFSGYVSYNAPSAGWTAPLIPKDLVREEMKELTSAISAYPTSALLQTKVENANLTSISFTSEAASNNITFSVNVVEKSTTTSELSASIASAVLTSFELPTTTSTTSERQTSIPTVLQTVFQLPAGVVSTPGLTNAFYYKSTFTPEFKSITLTSIQLLPTVATIHDFSSISPMPTIRSINKEMSTYVMQTYASMDKLTTIVSSLTSFNESDNTHLIPTVTSFDNLLTVHNALATRGNGTLLETTVQTVAEHLPVTGTHTPGPASRTTALAHYTTVSTYHTTDSTDLTVWAHQTTDSSDNMETSKANPSVTILTKQRLCHCPCTRKHAMSSLPSKQELDQQLSSMTKNLIIDTEQMSLARRKRMSVPDSRFLSIFAGCVSVILILLLLGFFLLSDILSPCVRIYDAFQKYSRKAKRFAA